MIIESEAFGKSTIRQRTCELVSMQELGNIMINND